MHDCNGHRWLMSIVCTSRSTASDDELDVQDHTTEMPANPSSCSPFVIYSTAQLAPPSEGPTTAIWRPTPAVMLRASSKRGNLGCAGQAQAGARIQQV